MLRCLIVDDEPLAQQVIVKHIAQTEQLHMVQVCRNAVEAFKVLHREKIDLIFLDIKMPSISGMDLLRSLKEPPLIIFTTAYSEYAAQSYELDAVDYLLKPVTYERFKKSMQKVLKLNNTAETTSEKDFVFIKVSGKLVRVFYRDILYLESLKDYIKVHTVHGNYVTLVTMKAIEELLPRDLFLRIHRSYLVAINSMVSIGPAEVKLEDIALPVGEHFKGNVKALRQKLGRQ